MGFCGQIWFIEKHLCGRTEEDINALVIEDTHSSGQEVTYEIIPKEIEALKHAIDKAEDGSYITALSDVVSNAIELMQEYQTKELQEEMEK